jgi:hypothetical protein
MIRKPGKNPSEPASYRLINFLPILSKFLEKNNTEKTDTYFSSKQYIPCTSIRLPAKSWYYTTGAPNNP